MKEPVYLDYNATTPLDREVIRAMEPFLAEVYGNPSSLHTQGVKARIAVENARRQVAAMLKCRPDEIIFTSGGTESNNLAIKGAAFSMRERGNHIITSEIEHPSVIEVCRYLEKEGFEVTYLPVDAWGMIDTARLRKEIRKSTILLTIMHANNETGTIQPVEEIGRIAGEAGILFHTDAAQSCGKIPVHADKIKADLISVAGHKLYAPKGTGALFVRRGVTLEKMMHGADHEQNLRAGTENVMSIAGLGKACERVSQQLPAYSRKMKEMRDQLHAGLKKSIPVQLNGHPVKRLPNTLNVSFPGADAQLMLSRMEGVAASAGAACHSGADITSPVLQAMKLTPEAMMGAIRFSVGRMTTGEDIRAAIKNITETYDALFRNQGNPSSPTPGKKEGIRLTSYTHSLGCACKIRPQLLEDLVKDLPVISRPEILVDMRTSDDAAAYLINPATALLQTVDFIPPVVDDPYDYGMIAAANALSDIY
ncbi:MAG TPA: IscS subfamily cysteine desulfurase, partial [Bacteroidales bacterium]|nr:IscS subfamily cysteine desulfurase [Bacteroidales bacterium]